jgi:hypothetical protein
MRHANGKVISRCISQRNIQRIRSDVKLLFLLCALAYEAANTLDLCVGQ